MQMKTILTEWRKFVNERVKLGEFYPQEFDQFISLVKEHENDIWVFFDTETTGLKYKEEQVQVTQIACAAYDVKDMTEGVEPKLLETFNKKIKLSPETLKYMEAQDEHIKGGGSVEGLSMRDILKMNQYFDESEEFLEIADVIKDFNEFLKSMESKSGSGKIVLIAQNSPFDVGVINMAYERLGLESPDYELWDTKAPLDLYFMPIINKIKEDPDASEEDKEIVDALTKVNKFGRPYISSSLGVVTAAFKLKDKGWHNALADVQMTIDMLFAVINFIKLKKEKYSIDFSTVKPFDATAGDPYSRKRS
jgi:DNA polymerase III epsilon subunit-like protein